MTLENFNPLHQRKSIYNYLKLPAVCKRTLSQLEIFVAKNV